MKQKKKFSLINDFTVPVMFIIICAVAIYFSGFTTQFLVGQVLTRFAIDHPCASKCLVE